jgi:molecular chaperone DnaK (HSP70)
MAIIPINLQDGSLAKAADVIVGIDLGTTNSLVAYMKDGQPYCVKGTDGKNALVPSVVHFAADRSVVVGDAAEGQTRFRPGQHHLFRQAPHGQILPGRCRSAGFFGYKILDDDTESLVKIRVKDRYFTPIELSADILRELKRRIETELGQPVSKAVITVPAYFNDNQRQATRDAGKLAGLDVLRIVNEPTAAALAYGIGLDPAGQQTETIAVYDLGGGTFDISILQIQEGIFEVLATNGDTFLGGDDFDQVIIGLFANQLGLSGCRPGDRQIPRARNPAARRIGQKSACPAPMKF